MFRGGFVRFLINTGEVDEARRKIVRAVEADEGDWRMWVTWGKLEGVCGNTVKAREIFKRATTTKGGRGRPEVWRAWGGENGRYSKASSYQSYHSNPFCLACLARQSWRWTFLIILKAEGSAWRA